MNKAAGFGVGKAIGGLSLTLLAGVFLAGVVHIPAILLVPKLADETASAYIQQSRLPSLQFTELTEQTLSASKLPVDRQFRALVCPFNLSDTPVAISAPISDRLWTLGVFDNASRNVYSLNDRLTASAGLEVVLVNASQLARLREIGAQELEKRVVVELEFDAGFALFRVFNETQNAPGDARDRPDQFVDALNCKPFVPDPDTLLPGQIEPDDNGV
ncbi:MAG: DUF1254 domain-containing protein [Pseudomonadota bacterium]